MSLYQIPAFGVSGENISLNACVGNNGYIDDKEYCLGYIESTIILAEKIIDLETKELHSSQFMYSIDTIIYPLCFNARHSVEILLKIILKSFISIISLRKNCISKKNELEKLLKSHNINAIYASLKSNSNLIDNRYVNLLSKIEPIVLDIGKIDPTGETFRYAFGHKKNNPDKKHLIDVGIISFEYLIKNFSLLREDTIKIIDINSSIEEEFISYGYSVSLSPSKIDELARELPPKNEWGRDFKKITKPKILEKYHISSNNFSTIVKLIEEDHTISDEIGVKNALFTKKIYAPGTFPNGPPITIDKLKSFFEFYTKSKIYINNNTDEDNINPDEILMENFKKENLIFNPEFAAALNALYLLPSYNIAFSRRYYSLYSENLNSFHDEESGYTFEGTLTHLMLRKGNVLMMVSRALGMLKQDEWKEILFLLYEKKENKVKTKEIPDDITRYKAIVSRIASPPRKPSL